MSKERTIAGWKAYDHNMECKNGKKYEVGKVYEEEEAVICRKGIHYCENPMDLMAYKDIIDDSGELMAITKVEDLDPDGGDMKVDNNTSKRCTKKLKIGAKVSFKDWVREAVNFEIDSVKDINDDLAASGDYSQLASSGDYSRLASSGDYSRLAASGDYSRLSASGDYSRLSASGYCSVVAAVGENSIAKASKGSWITLAEYENCIPICVKTEQVDGKRIKENTWYKLKNGEFTEVYL